MTASFIVTYFYQDGTSRDEKVCAENGEEAGVIAQERLPRTSTGFEVQGLTLLAKYRRPMAAVPQKQRQIS